jgi:hypothetical protein
MVQRSVRERTFCWIEYGQHFQTSFTTFKRFYFKHSTFNSTGNSTNFFADNKTFRYETRLSAGNPPIIAAYKFSVNKPTGINNVQYPT